MREREYEITDLLCHFGLDGKVRFFNHQWKAVFGGSPDGLDDSMEGVIHPEDRSRFRDVIQQLRSEASVSQVKLRHRFHDEDWLAVTWNFYANPTDGSVYGIGNHLTGKSYNELLEAQTELEERLALRNEQLAKTIDELKSQVQKRQESEVELRKLARTDDLTGLHNRRYFLELARLAFERSRRFKHCTSFAMIDIDHFKSINDTYGHDAGDHVLSVFAAVAFDNVRNIDIVGRLGGEEFGILLPETNTEGAMLSAERLRKKVEDLTVLRGDRKIRFTISIGIATEVEYKSSIEMMMERADRALYAAKQSGRNKVMAH